MTNAISLNDFTIFLPFVELYTIFKNGLTKRLIERKRPHRNALLLKMLLLQEGHHLHFIYSKIRV